MFSTSSLDDGFLESFGKQVPMLISVTANFDKLAFPPLTRIFA
jgi:hypothetical protein